jgi:cytidylate kinase
MIIAIDGPAGSGKSSVAKAVSEQLNFRHIDTGAMYRAVAWKSRELGIETGEEDLLAELANNIKIEFVPGPNGQQVMVDGTNATVFLKDEDIGRRASTIATQGEVRAALVDKQRQMGKTGNLVMDGRDIGTVVFPNADVKIFLDAAPEVRGKRRFLELKEKVSDLDRESIIHQVKQRDHEDRSRKISPLRPAEDAVTIDTTHLDLNEVINKVMRLVQPPGNN